MHEPVVLAFFQGTWDAEACALVHGRQDTLELTVLYL